MKLSVVLGGRDDNYGKNFIERLNQAVSTNLSLLDSSGIDYEIVVVDYNPIEENYLHKNPILADTLSHSKIKNVIVHNSVILAENLHPTGYYEYFAKNAGMRKSDGDFILLVNSDIMLSKELIDTISSEMNNPDADNYFYRTRYRGEVELGNQPNEETELVDMYDASVKSDAICAAVCGQCSGDATVFSRKVMFETATGYYEGDERHRTPNSQAHMDSEIVWNCYQKGKALGLFEVPYYHIAHERPHVRDGYFATYVYSNNDDWGCAKYETTNLNENTQIISA